MAPTSPGLPGWGSGTSALQTGSFQQPNTIYANDTWYYHNATGTWWLYDPPTIGPSSDPGIPGALATINYRPITAVRLGATIPLPYGRVKLGGLGARLRKWGSNLMALMVWGRGEIDAVEKVFSDSTDITILTQVAAYTGTATQTANSAVASLYGQADRLLNIAYSVLQLRPVDGLNLWAILRGRKVYDPRTDTTVYSANAALCLADLIDHYTPYSVDWDFAEYAADYCDVQIAPGIKRWEINMPLSDPRHPWEWMAILAEYANCYVFIDGGVAKIVPDEPRDVDHVLTGANVRDLQLRKVGPHDTPTQVICKYTLAPATGEWDVLDERTGDPPDGTPLRITMLDMQGYQHAIQAKRKAVQFQNYANIADLWCTFTMFDPGLKVTKGDVFSLTHPVGLNAKKFRVLNVKPLPRGRWYIEGREYSELLYSDEVVADPNVPDTDLPAINNVPTPANLVLSEVLYNIAPGETRSKLVASVDAVVYPFTHVYEWSVLRGSTVLHTATTASPAMTWGPLPIDGGVTYLVRCRVKGPISFGSYQSGEINILGKLALPLPPTNFRCFEAQGTVFFAWAAGMDVDLRGYEIRYGTEDQDWEFMELVNRWGIAAAGETSLVPPGTWTFEIRSFDSVRTTTNPIGQYSATGLRQEVLVDSDRNSFHIADYPLTFGGATAQFSDSSSVEFGDGSDVEFAESGGDSSNVRLVKGTWWTDSGESWDDVFGSDPLTGKSNPIVTYLSDTASVLASQEIDFGQVLSLTLSVTSMAEAVIGSVDTFIESKVLEGDAWTRHSLPVVKATAQFARVVYETDSTSRMKCGPDDYGTLHADVVANEMRGDVETDGIGPTTVDLGVAVTKFRFIGVTAIGSGIKTALEDVTVGDPGTFDVYFLDEDTNDHVAASGYWLAQYY